jgi:hypothetical protein
MAPVRLSAVVDPVERAGDVDEAFRLRIEALASCEAQSPFGCAAASPRVGRPGKRLAAGAAVALRDEVVEGAAKVPQRCAAVGAVEGGADERFAARMQAP